MKKYNRLLSIDSLRGVCALAVVCYHMNMFSGFVNLNFFKNSDLFVDFFFVLSGFVISYTYWNRINTIKEIQKFMLSRLIRICPLHIFFLVIFIIMESAKLYAYKYQGAFFNNLPFDNPNSLVDILWNLLLLQSWVPDANYNSFNYTSWSISVEFYLYVFYAVVIFLFPTRKKCSIFLVIALSALFRHYSIEQQDAYLIRLSNGVFCFSLGALSFLCKDKISDMASKAHAWVWSLMEISLLIIVINIVSNDTNVGNYIFPVLSAVIISIFSVEKGVISFILKMKSLVKIGSLSYSIYMVHPLIIFSYITIFSMLDSKFGFDIVIYTSGVRRFDFGLANNIICLLIVASVVIFSIITKKYVEELSSKVIHMYFKG